VLNNLSGSFFLSFAFRGFLLLLALFLLPQLLLQADELPAKMLCYDKMKEGTDIYRTISPGLPELKFRLKKRYGGKRIVLMGGTAVHYYMSGAVESLKNRLKEALPDSNIELLYCAYPERESIGDLRALREMAELGPDIVLLISGADDLRDPMFAPEPRNELRRLRLSGLKPSDIRTAVTNVRKKYGPAAGAEETAEKVVKNISKFQMICREKAISPVIATIPANIRHFPPAGALPFNNSVFARGWVHAGTKKISLAIDSIREYAAVNAGDASAYYALARLLDISGQIQMGMEYYARAGDMDNSPRASRILNNAIRRFGESREIPLLDIERTFTALSDVGLSGDEQFLDSVHWKKSFNDLITAGILRFFWEQDSLEPGSFLALPGDWKTDWFKQTIETFNKRTYARDGQGDARMSVAYGADRAAWDYPLISEKAVACFEMAFASDAGSLKKAAKNKSGVVKDSRGIPGLWAGTAEIDSRWPVVIMNIAEVYRRMGMEKEALYYFKKALETDPSLKTAHMYKAFMFRNAGKGASYKKELEGIKWSTMPEAKLLEE